MSLPPVRSTANLQQGQHSLLPLGRAAPALASPMSRLLLCRASARPLPSAPLAQPEFALPARTRPTPPWPRLWAPRGSGMPRQAQTSPTGAATPTETATHGAAGREGRVTVADSTAAYGVPCGRVNPKGRMPLRTWCPTLAQEMLPFSLVELNSINPVHIPQQRDAKLGVGKPASGRVKWGF